MTSKFTTRWINPTLAQIVPVGFKSSYCLSKSACQQGLRRASPGDLYRLRIWLEYGFRQCKQELGWTDYRFTHFKDIERWWEIIFSVSAIISLNSQAFLSLSQSHQIQPNVQESNCGDFSNHQDWNHGNGWKNTLNNLR